MSTIKPLVYDAANARLAEQAVVIPPGYIDGLNLVWNSGTSISVTSGSAYIEGAAAVVNMPAALTLSGLSLTASTWYHVYLYLNSGVPAIECVTTDPATAYSGTARSKTGDTSRRYIGSLLTDSAGQVLNFKHISDSGAILYRCKQDLAPFRALQLGNAIVETNVSLAGAIPVTADAAQLRLFNSGTSLVTSYSTSDDSASGPPKSSIAAVAAGANAYIPFPVDSTQAITYWNWTTPEEGTGAFVDVYGYYFGR